MGWAIVVTGAIFVALTAITAIPMLALGPAAFLVVLPLTIPMTFLCFFWFGIYRRVMTHTS